MTPAGVAPPVRREQARERRHEDDVADVGHGPGERLDLRRVADDAEVVAQPLDERAGDRDRSLEGVRGRTVAEARGHGRDEAVVGVDRPLARVHEHETAGPVGALDLAGLEAGLAEEGGLLVAQVARDRDAGEVPHARARRPRTTSGSRAASPPARRPRRAAPGSQASDSRPISIVREAFVTSVTCTPPRRTAGQVPDQPRCRSSRTAGRRLRRPPAARGRRHRGSRRA